MPNTDTDTSPTHLRLLRRRSGLPLREVARRLDVLHTKLVHWENTGKIPQPETVFKLAEIYGVSVEEVLGQAPAARASKRGPSKLGRVFEAAAKLPRRQQEKIIEFVQPFINSHANGSADS